MDQSGTRPQVKGPLFRVCKFMGQSGTRPQVKGSLFQVCKFIDQSGTGPQVKGPLLYFTHLLYSLSGNKLLFHHFCCKNGPQMTLLNFTRVIQKSESAYRSQGIYVIMCVTLITRFQL
jgi:hypothetical protein